MTTGLIIAALGLGLMATAASAARLIEDRADAVAYVDQTFAANACHFNHAAFMARMVDDGVAPGVDDMAQPMIGTDKIIRQRRILAAIEELFQQGALVEDPKDPTNAISKFGGCA